MDENGIVIKCANCGRHLRNDEQPCPYCGYTGRNISVCLSDSIGMNESARGKMTNPTANVKSMRCRSFTKEIPIGGMVKRLLIECGWLTEETTFTRKISEIRKRVK